MKFSIIIPFYKTKLDYLKNALLSIRNQTYNTSKIDVIIYQDGCQTNLTKVLLEFNDLNITLLLGRRNRGISFARNQAITYSKSEYFILLDSDDELMADCVESFHTLLITDRSVNICFSNAIKYCLNMLDIERLIDSSLYYRYFKRYKNNIQNPIYHSIFIGHCIMIKREIFIQNNMFNENIYSGEITDFMLRAYTSGINISYINKYLYKYRNNPNGLSKNIELNKNRFNSIRRAIKTTFGISLQRKFEVFRAKPFQHNHFTLYFKKGNPIDIKFISKKNNFKMQKIISKDKHNIDYIYKERVQPKANIILCHGITVDKNEYDSLFVKAEYYFGNNNFNTIRFDFRGHGNSKMPQEKMTIKGECLDLEAVVDFVKSKNSLPIFIVGTSFGAISTIDYASKSYNEISALILWNPVLDINKTFISPGTNWSQSFINNSSLSKVNNLGYLMLENYKIGSELVNEMREFDLKLKFQSLSIPIIIYHGTGDNIVPFQYSLDYQMLNKAVEIVSLSQQGHGFKEMQSFVIEDSLRKINNIL